MTATILEIMDEMVATLETAYASVEPQVQVVFGVNPSPTGIAIDIYPGDIAAGEESIGFGELTGELIFTLRARIAGDLEATQRLLIQMMDEEEDLCIVFALTDDPTLNGLASSVKVEPPTGFVRYADDQMGVQWRTTVIRARS